MCLILFSTVVAFVGWIIRLYVTLAKVDRSLNKAQIENDCLHRSRMAFLDFTVKLSVENVKLKKQLSDLPHSFLGDDFHGEV